MLDHGKTAVSIISAYKAVKSGYQVAVMAPTAILSKHHLKNFEEILLKDRRFIRTHKSYFVNFDEVMSFNKSDGGSLQMKNGSSIPVSSEKSHLIMERIQIVKR